MPPLVEWVGCGYVYVGFGSVLSDGPFMSTGVCLIVCWCFSFCGDLLMELACVTNRVEANEAI